jgi:hypothetical protein
MLQASVFNSLAWPRRTGALLYVAPGSIQKFGDVRKTPNLFPRPTAPTIWKGRIKPHNFLDLGTRDAEESGYIVLIKEIHAPRIPIAVS